VPTEAELLEADIAAREAALDVGRSFIVQAPAGSGKTELLIQRYLKLLATVDEPEEVLAITFTKKAAAEMRERIVAALSRAAAGDEPDARHEKITFASALAVLQRDRENDWELISAPKRMRIQTLDSFCAGVARLLPVTSGLGAGSAIVQDHGARRLYEEAAAATLDWLVEEGPSGAAIETVLSHLDNNTGQYIRYLSDMLQSRDQWLQITGSGIAGEAADIRERLEKTLAEVVEHRLEDAGRRLASVDIGEVVRLVRYAAGNLIGSGAGSPGLDALAEARDLPGADVDSLEAWRRLADFFLTNDDGWRRQVNKNQGFPPKDAGEKADFMACIERLAAVRSLDALLAELRRLPEARYADEQWDVLLALFRLLPLAVSELKRVFAERGACDHAEVAMAASSALGTADAPGDMAMMLDYRIRHLLVDEMQDTSISQYSMLHTLVSGWVPGDGRSFFCVGDPMQSIYRFRDAEVGQFVRARGEGLENLPLEPLTLRRNFRSGEHLVHWFNTVFSQVFPDEDDPDSGAVSYSASVPVDDLRGSGLQSVHPLVEVSAEQESKYAAGLVEDALQSTADETIAVLVRSRTQLPDLLAELRNRSIAYQAVEIDRLTDLPEIIELLALTRAIAHPGDRAAWLGLLRSPLVGLSWSDLHALVSGDRDAVVWDLLRDSDRLAALSGDGRRRVEQFLPEAAGFLAVERCRSLRLRVETAWFRLGGPVCMADDDQLANAYRYLDILEKLEVAGTLADPAALQSALEAERVSSEADANCRVQVMTMHKAKGLQFHHVILPFLGRYTSGSQRAVLNWLHIPTRSGNRELIISPVGPGSEADPLHRFIEESARTSDRHELDRLLYVACTRARGSLRLVFNLRRSNDGELASPHAGSLLNRLWPAIGPAVEAELSQYPEPECGDAASDPESVLREPTLRRLPVDLPRYAVPPLPPARSTGAGGNQPEIYEVQFDWVGAAARDAGTLVHRWMQALALSGAFDAASDAHRRRETTRQWALALGVSEDRLDSVLERVDTALTAALEDERGRWVLDGEGHAELALTGLWQGTVRSVVIDRVRIADGAHWIIDYKTSTHQGGGLERFIDQEAARYEQQLDRYREIYTAWSGASEVRTALYFPVMKVFREVTPGEATAPA